MPDSVWFWQRIVTPHMAGLAEALAKSGRNVTYVAERPMSAERAALGWRAAKCEATTLRFAPDAASADELVAEAPKNSIHICQGFRGNGVVGSARNALAKRGLRQWVVMETVQERGWATSVLKRIEYARLILAWRDRIEGVLAIGHATPAWLADRGMPAERIVPFAYFLADAKQAPPTRSADAPFRFLFVGRLVDLKRVDTLIDALALIAEHPFELVVVGAGPLEADLRRRAKASLGDRVTWLGQRPIEEMPTIMADADCLVLPSRHDGWGAVVSEALMAGTPAVCSLQCGAAGVVKASGVGAVFAARDVAALRDALQRMLERGRSSLAERTLLAQWGRCLGADEGADYLSHILADDKLSDKMAPWQSDK